jgi:NADH:ubiquinone oxidoreductase subunit 2 (subunit N)
MPPAAYTALTYTDTFLHRQAPWLFLLLLVNIPMFLVVIVQGCWSARMRRVETVLSLVLCAVMAWTVLDGPIFLAQASDEMAKVMMGLIVLVTLASIAYKEYRSVRPNPKGEVHAGR